MLEARMEIVDPGGRFSSTIGDEKVDGISAESLIDKENFFPMKAIVDPFAQLSRK